MEEWRLDRTHCGKTITQEMEEWRLDGTHCGKTITRDGRVEVGWDTLWENHHTRDGRVEVGWDTLWENHVKNPPPGPVEAAGKEESRAAREDVETLSPGRREDSRESKGVVRKVTHSAVWWHAAVEASCWTGTTASVGEVSVCVERWRQTAVGLGRLLQWVRCLCGEMETDSCWTGTTASVGEVSVCVERWRQTAVGLGRQLQWVRCVSVCVERWRQTAVGLGRQLQWVRCVSVWRDGDRQLLDWDDSFSG